MTPPIRIILVALSAITCHGAAAQSTVVTPAVTVQQLAPQLVTFAGSPANFQSLVNGLAQGTAVQLVTVLPTGFTQVATFTPGAGRSPTEIAQLLETTRQQLIGLGIGVPTAEQLANAVVGGVVPTTLGGAQLPGVANARNLPSPAAQLQSGNAAAGATAATGTATGGVNVQLLPSASTGTTAAGSAVQRINTSDSLAPAGATSRSATVGPTSASPAGSTSASPQVGNTSASPTPTLPSAAPGAGSAPPTAERVRPGTPPAKF